MFIVSISLLRKILNECQNEIHGIVAYTFLNVCEKNHQSTIKKMHTKENWFFFSASRCTIPACDRRLHLSRDRCVVKVVASRPVIG